MEQVLQNINRLNRNLESIITVGIMASCIAFYDRLTDDTRSETNSVLSRPSGLSLRTSWARLRRPKKAVKGSGRSAGRAKDKAIILRKKRKTSLCSDKSFYVRDICY